MSVVKNTTTKDVSQDLSKENGFKPQEDEEMKCEKEKRRQQEEEKCRQQEEEKRRQQEEEDRKREEEEKIKMGHWQKSLLDEEKRLDQLKALREKNVNAKSTHLDAASLKKLNSSLDKNTAFIKKLATKLSEEHKPSLLKEMRNLNLTRYISEAVNAIVTANIKLADIEAAVAVCSEFHQLYGDFTSELITRLVKVIHEKEAPLLRKRNVIRFLADLFIAGVYSDSNIVFSTTKDILESKTNPINLLQVVTTILKTVSRDLFNIVDHPTIVELFELPEEEKSKNHDLIEIAQRILEKQKAITNSLMPEERKAKYLNMFNRFYDIAGSILLKENESLRESEKSNQKLLQTKGEISEEATNDYTKRLDQFNKFLSMVQTLANILNRDMIVIPVESVIRTSESSTRQEKDIEGEEKEELMWDDEDSYKFYKVLPDLKDYVPPILLGITDTKGDKKEDMPQEKEPESTKDESNPDENTTDTDDFKAFLLNLNNSLNRDLIDKAASDFCCLNKKAYKRRLVSYMFNVSRTKLEILPYYARFIAILNPYFPEIGKDLIARLEDEFNTLFKEKDQINLETKIKNIRFLSELVKFSVCPHNIIFNCLNQCLEEFRHHDVDIACTLLETCGRYLYKNPTTNIRMNILLDKMMKKKNLKTMTSRQEIMIENAYYYCKPPERQASKEKTLTPIQQYITHLIYEKLTTQTLNFVFRQIRKLNWERDAKFLFKSLTDFHSLNYEQISNLVALIAALLPYHPELSLRFVDHVFEELRKGLEEHSYSNNQRLYIVVRVIGELYAFKLIKQTAFFETLYSLTRFGHGVGNFKDSNSVIDPPTSTFRVRLICNLLDSCKPFFSGKKATPAMDLFFIYFQRYFLSKVNISMDLFFTIDDIFESMQPKTKRFGSFDEANKAIQGLEDQQRDKNTDYLSPDVLSSIPFKIATNNQHQHDYETKEISLPTNIDNTEEAEVNEATLKQTEAERIRKEEEDFEREFQMMVTESRDQRKKDTSFTGKDASLAPLVSMGIADDVDVSYDGKNQTQETIKFHVLLKKGVKSQTAPLEIPKETQFVRRHLQALDEEKAKQEEIKRQTLKFDSMEREIDRR